MSTQVALRLSKAAISLKFKSTNPKATAWARAHAAELVKDVTDNTRAALRRTITRGFEEQLTVDEMTKMIRSTIGLTEQGADSLMDFRRELEDADGATVRGVDVPEGGLSDERISKLIEDYSDDLVDTRAETIARTETMRASNEGQLELWEQGVEEGFFSADDQKLWILTDDDRLCPICEAMDGTTVPLDEEFVLEELDGETVDAPPAHPRCRCTVGLVLAPEVKAATRHAEFDESEHPRDDAGQFTDGGGGSSAGADKAPPSLPSNDASVAEWKQSLKEQKEYAKAAGFHSIHVGKGVDPMVASHIVHNAARERSELEAQDVKFPSKMSLHVALPGTTVVGARAQFGLDKEAYSADAFGTYNGESKVLYINGSRDPGMFQEDATRGLTTGFKSSGAQWHTITHELGHAAHAKKGGFAGSKNWDSDDPAAIGFAHSVSRYAATNRLEFVAETFAGARAGKTYSPGVLKLYADLKGPKLPKPGGKS